MSSRPNEATPIPLRWTDGILIITTILLLSFALIAQAMPQRAEALGEAIAFLDTGERPANASDEE